MIRWVSSTTVRPTSSTVTARLIRADAAWSTSSWAARAAVCSNSSALARAIAAWVARVEMKATSPLVQATRLALSADRAPMTRPLWISGAARWPAISGTPSYRAWPYWPIGRGCPAKARTWPVRRTSPTQPSSRRRTGRRPATSSARPAQAVTSRRSSRSIRMVDASARNPRLVSSTIIRMSVSRSCEAARRPAIPGPCRGARRAPPRRGGRRRVQARSTVGSTTSGWASVRVGRSPPTNRRKIEPPPLAPVAEVVGTAVEGPSRTGVSSGPSRRARTSRWSHRDGRSREAAIGPGARAGPWSRTAPCR